MIQLLNYKCTFPFPVSLNLSDEGKQTGISSSLLNLGFNRGFSRRLAPKKLSIEFLLMKSLNPNLFDNHWLDNQSLIVQCHDPSFESEFCPFLLFYYKAYGLWFLWLS